jgi:hypothetical protein
LKTEKNFQEFIKGVCALSVKQLEAVSRKSFSLLYDLTADQIGQIIQVKVKKDKDLNFCAIVLNNTPPSYLPQLLCALSAEQLGAVSQKEPNPLCKLATDKIKELLCALDTERLGVVLKNVPNLLIRLSFNQIGQIIDGKGPDFRATVLRSMLPYDLFEVLKANFDGKEFGRVATTFADMNLNQVVAVLARVLSDWRLEVMQHLQNPKEKLAGITNEQRTALLQGLYGDKQRQMEALLPAPAD